MIEDRAVGVSKNGDWEYSVGRVITVQGGDCTMLESC